MNNKGAREAGWKKKKVGGITRLMKRRAKHIREGQARERKKEGKPAYFRAYLITRFMKTGLVKSKRQRAEGTYSYTSARHST
jgi:hypothetical protein